MSRNFIKAFAHHGFLVEDAVGEDNLVGDCHFCGKENHLRVNKQTGQWRCLVCESAGNLYTFIRKWHEHCLAETSKEKLKELSKDRGISLALLEARKLAFDSLNECWLLPINKRNDAGKVVMVNLKTWKRIDAKTTEFQGTPTCAQHIYNIDALLDFEGEQVYIAEGEWDTLALIDSESFSEEEACIVGLPGAQTFKDEWADLFGKKNVVLLHDNDEPGRSGVRTVTKRLSMANNAPSSIKVLTWPEGTPSGFDIRDLYKKVQKEQKKNPEMTVGTFIQEHLCDSYIDDLEIKRNTWQSVIEDFKSLYRVDQSFTDAATCVAAACVAARVPGEPLWLFLVGPPSTSKSVIIDAFAYDKEHCEILTKFTATQMVSGWKQPGTDEDVSIFPTLKNRTLLVSDWTAVLSMSGAAQEELYGLLREAYRGEVRIKYGNGKVIDVKDVYYSTVAGVTDAIRSVNNSDLGERFLKVEVIGEEYDTIANSLAAMDGIVKDATQIRKLKTLGASIQGYLDSLDYRIHMLPMLDEPMKLRIAHLSNIIGHLRAVVAKEGDDLEYRPRAEGGTRVSKQLAKLGQSLAVLLKRNTIDDECFRLVVRTAIDTIRGIPLDIVSLIAKFPDGVTTDVLAGKLNLPKTTVVRRTHDLQSLNVICRGKQKSGSVGRSSNLWYLVPKFRTSWEASGIELASQKTKAPKKAKAKVEL